MEFVIVGPTFVTERVKLSDVDPPKPSLAVTSTVNEDAADGARPHTVPFTGPTASHEAFVERDHARVSLSGSVPLKSRPYGLPVWTESDATPFEIVGSRFRTETCRTAVVARAVSPETARAEKEKLNVPRVPTTRTRK